MTKIKYLITVALFFLLGCYEENISFENPNPKITLKNFAYETVNQESYAKFLINYQDEQGDFGYNGDLRKADSTDFNLIFDIYDENNLLVKTENIILLGDIGLGAISQGEFLRHEPFNIFTGQVFYSMFLTKRFEPFEEDKLYYIIVKAIDQAGNISNEVSTPVF